MVSSWSFDWLYNERRVFFELWHWQAYSPEASFLFKVVFNSLHTAVTIHSPWRDHHCGQSFSALLMMVWRAAIIASLILDIDCFLSPLLRAFATTLSQNVGIDWPQSVLVKQCIVTFSIRAFLLSRHELAGVRHAILHYLDPFPIWLGVKTRGYDSIKYLQHMLLEFFIILTHGLRNLLRANHRWNHSLAVRIVCRLVISYASN